GCQVGGIAAVGGAFLRALDQHLGVPQDAAEDVVEVVRDTAGEAAHRLHLFRLAQPLLEARALGVRELALGDVAQVHYHRADPRLVQQVADGVLDPAPRAVLVADAYFLHHDLARLTKGLVALAHRALMVLGVDELEILLAAHLVEAVAGEALEGRADVEDAARA